MNRKNLSFVHKDLANGRWMTIPFPLQMGNIGSEVSRAVNSKARGNTERMTNAAYRAIELFEFTIDDNLKNPGRLKEICRAKEEFCDYIFGDNTFNTDPQKMVHYYDQFVSLAK